MEMTKRKPKVSLWKTDFIAYKITDKTTGDQRLSVVKNGESIEKAFSYYVNSMSGQAVQLPTGIDLLEGEARKEAVRKWSSEVDDFVKKMNDRRADFVIELAPDPFIPC